MILLTKKCPFIDYDYMMDSMNCIKKTMNVEPYHIPMLSTHLVQGGMIYITPCTDGEIRQLHLGTHIFETEKVGNKYYVTDLVRSYLLLNKSIESRLLTA